MGKLYLVAACLISVTSFAGTEARELRRYTAIVQNSKGEDVKILVEVSGDSTNGFAILQETKRGGKFDPGYLDCFMPEMEFEITGDKGLACGQSLAEIKFLGIKRY